MTGKKVSNSRPLRISVTSGKGGVGKTNIVVNLGSILSDMGRKVLVVDCDLGLANIDVLLGISPEYNLHDVVSEKIEIERVVVDSKAGFDLLPASSGVTEMVDLAPDDQFRLVTQLNDLFLNYDIVLLDTGAGITSLVIRFNQSAQENIIIVTPEPTSITDAYALMKVLNNKLGRTKFHLLANMVKNEKEGIEVSHNLSQVASRFLKIKTRYLGSIPTDPVVRRAVVSQQVFALGAPNSEATKAAKSIAAVISNWSSHDNGDVSSLFS